MSDPVDADLLLIARNVGLRQAMHGVPPQRARVLLRAFLDAANAAENAATDFILGMSISVDVTPAGCTEERRYFGTVTVVQESPDDKHGVTLLVQDAEPNFSEPVRPAEHVVDANKPMLTDIERQAIRDLIDVTEAAYFALDDSEERVGDNGREHVIDSTNFDELSDTLDKLEELPDDQPGYTLGPAGKARWALRRLLKPADHSEDVLNMVPALPAWWAQFIQNICEMPDRTSPEDEPAAMVATADELEACAISAIEKWRLRVLVRDASTAPSPERGS